VLYHLKHLSFERVLFAQTYGDCFRIIV